MGPDPSVTEAETERDVEAALAHWHRTNAEARQALASAIRMARRVLANLEAEPRSEAARTEVTQTVAWVTYWAAQVATAEAELEMWDRAR